MGGRKRRHKALAEGYEDIPAENVVDLKELLEKALAMLKTEVKSSLPLNTSKIQDSEPRKSITLLNTNHHVTDDDYMTLNMLKSEYRRQKEQIELLKMENVKLRTELQAERDHNMRNDALAFQVKQQVETSSQKIQENREEISSIVKQEPETESQGFVMPASVLSEHTQLEDDYQDPMFQTQQSNLNSSPTKNGSSPVKRSSPLKSSPRQVKVYEDSRNNFSDDHTPLFSSNLKGRLLVDMSKVLTDMTTNPIADRPWYPEDFELVPGFERIDDNYGQSLDNIPSNTRFYYENQLAYIQELATHKFHKIALGMQDNTKFPHNVLRSPRHYVTPPQDPLLNLQDARIANEFKFEVNETNLHEYMRLYADITRTRKVKRWCIDHTPGEWHRSEFPSTQEQALRNARGEAQAQRRALLRLFHACYLIKDGVHCGMWRFKNSKLNEFACGGQFHIDVSVFN